MDLFVLDLIDIFFYADNLENVFEIIEINYHWLFFNRSNKTNCI